jgi:hypothetical protein
MKHILYIAFSAAILYSCNSQSKKDKPQQATDSVNNIIDKLFDDQPPGNNSFYDSLQKKWPDTSAENSYKYTKVQAMRYSVNGFYAYVNKLRRDFYRFCGDSTGERLLANAVDSVTLTQEFFLEKKSDASLLFAQLVAVTHHFNINASSETAYGMVKKLTSVSIEKYTTADKFMEQYFKTAPPATAITILNSFEAQVLNTEAKILIDYLIQ